MTKGKAIGAALLIALATAVIATAETVVSGDFSIGLGKTSATGAWTTTETAGVNTDVTGPFTLNVAASCSGFYGSAGTTFGNRVLATGATGSEFVGSVALFDNLTVTANYTGELIEGGSITLVVDSVRIWASNTHNTSQYVFWFETTPGNTGQQTHQALGAVSGYMDLAGYQNIDWNPGEQAVAGTSSTRTFDLNGATVTHICIDGIEVFGHVEYGIPEEEWGAELELLRVDKISFDAADHNAFTSLVRYDDMFYCTWREGTAHVSDDGKLRVARSADGTNWTSVALVSRTGADLRDPKLRVVPDGRLMLHSPEYDSVGSPTYRNLAWFTSDGTNWTEAVPIAEDEIWFWKHTWKDGTGYGVGYYTSPPYFTRLYTSTDATNWTIHVNTFFNDGYPNESSIVFMPDGTAHCLLRRDNVPNTAQLGTASPPYTDWTWQDLGIFAGGPEMIRLPGNRLLATVRLLEPVRTSLCWIDPDGGVLTEALTLPSGGDTSYAGMVWHDGRLWISYYSGTTSDASVYIAEVAYNPEPVTVMDFAPVPGNMMKAVLDIPGVANGHSIMARTNLVAGSTWTNVAHSYTNDVATMFPTNLGYSTTDTNGNAVIYVEADDANKFFRIIAE